MQLNYNSLRKEKGKTLTLKPPFNSPIVEILNYWLLTELPMFQWKKITKKIWNYFLFVGVSCSMLNVISYHLILFWKTQAKQQHNLSYHCSFFGRKWDFVVTRTISLRWRNFVWADCERKTGRLLNSDVISDCSWTLNQDIVSINVIRIGK